MQICKAGVEGSGVWLKQSSGPDSGSGLRSFLVLQPAFFVLFLRLFMEKGRATCFLPLLTSYLL